MWTLGSAPALILVQVLPLQPAVLTYTPYSVPMYTSLGRAGSTVAVKTGSSGRAPDMSVHVVPPSSVRKTWPGWLPEPFQPENVTMALRASAGCVVIHVAARLGSTGLFGRGEAVVFVQLAALSVVTQT